jgi:hypothetical protein
MRRSFRRWFAYRIFRSTSELGRTRDRGDYAQRSSKLYELPLQVLAFIRPRRADMNSELFRKIVKGISQRLS